MNTDQTGCLRTRRRLYFDKKREILGCTSRINEDFTQTEFEDRCRRRLTMELTQIGRHVWTWHPSSGGCSEQEDDEGQRVRIADLVGELDQIGRETESPIRIGVLGGFSSGKTRLMECLIGAGGRLPVSVNPSTGNITVLAFHADQARGKPDSRALRSSSSRAGMPANSSAHLKQKADPLVAGAELRLQLSRLQFDDLDVWEKAKAWALEARQKEAQKYELVDLCYELHRFASAYQACGPSLQGKRIPVDEETAMAAMVSSGDVTAYRTLSVVQFPPAPAAFDPQADRLDPTRIAGLFPLIRSVRVDVQVPEPIAARLGSGSDPSLRAGRLPGARGRSVQPARCIPLHAGAEEHRDHRDRRRCLGPGR